MVGPGERAAIDELARRYGGAGDAVVIAAPSGAMLGYAGSVVVKVHHPRTLAGALEARVRAAADPLLGGLLLPPVTPEVHRTPEGRLATVWPRVTVLGASDEVHPWAEAGALLARLHLVDHVGFDGLPVARPQERVTRAVGRLVGPGTVAHSVPRATKVVVPGRAGARRRTTTPATPGSGTAVALLHRLGDAITAEAEAAPPGRHLLHGDWHLGQLGRRSDSAVGPAGGWRLLDVDDLGRGDPVWDLGRPAGFWAAGLLPDGDWEAFLAGYRGAGGPGVPPHGDPWPRLDLPARAAVVVAASRALTRPEPGEEDVAEALLEACARM